MRQTHGRGQGGARRVWLRAYVVAAAVAVAGGVALEVVTGAGAMVPRSGAVSVAAAKTTLPKACAATGTLRVEERLSAYRVYVFTAGTQTDACIEIGSATGGVVGSGIVAKRPKAGAVNAAASEQVVAGKRYTVIFGRVGSAVKSLALVRVHGSKVFATISRSWYVLMWVGTYKLKSLLVMADGKSQRVAVPLGAIPDGGCPTSAGCISAAG